MLAKLIRVEALQKSGTSKTGNPYVLDFTKLAIAMPINTDNEFGIKEEVYEYGDYNVHKEFIPYRDKLPLDVEVTLGNQFDRYGKSQTVITNIKILGKTDVSNVSK